MGVGERQTGQVRLGSPAPGTDCAAGAPGYGADRPAPAGGQPRAGSAPPHKLDLT